MIMSMDETLFVRILIGCIVGFISGLICYRMHIRAGLTRDEWQYFKAFLSALRNGTYTVTEDRDDGETEG